LAKNKIAHAQRLSEIGVEPGHKILFDWGNELVTCTYVFERNFITFYHCFILIKMIVMP